MTPKPKLPGHALNLEEFPDFESCLESYLDGSPDVEPRVFEALLATVVSGFRHNGWDAGQWLSFAAPGRGRANRLAFAAAYFFRRCLPGTPGEEVAGDVLNACSGRLEDPWPELYIGTWHRPGTPFAEEAHVRANLVLPDFDKKINWNMDKYRWKP